MDMTSIQDIFTSALNSMVQLVSTYVPNLLGALVILVLGWLIALVVSMFVGMAMSKTRLSKLIAESLHGTSVNAEKGVAKTTKTIVYYLLMLFVLVAFFQALNLTMITVPLNQMLSKIFDFAPNFIAAVAILAIAWLIATVVKNILVTVFTKTNLDEKLSSKTGKKTSVSISTSIASTAYWLIMLMMLPVVLNTLGLTQVLGPVNQMFTRFLGHLPNIFSAVIILVVGWFIAGIVRQVVTNLLASAGADGLIDSMGLTKTLGANKISEILGLVVYVFILFPVLISSLDTLSLDAIVGPATNMLNQIFSIIPGIFAALIMLAIAGFVAKLASGLVESLLKSIGFDNILSWVGVENKVKEENAPSKLVSKLVLIAIILFASMEAFSMIGLESISALLNQFIVFAGQILLGVIILLVGVVLANFAAKAIQSTGTAQAGILSGIARAGILILASAMGLREMGFANEIINLAFGLLFGAVAVAIALAFGLGCKDLAAKQAEKIIKDLSN
jgi:hypothetical protein